jgi:hypothetical protein
MNLQKNNFTHLEQNQMQVIWMNRRLTKQSDNDWVFSIAKVLDIEFIK